MLTDYHNHCLPGIDDGAESRAVSLRMLARLKRQGMERVVATPHFYSHRESAESFLLRRAAAFARLSAVAADPPIVLGAEVALERGLSAKSGLDRLTLGESRYLLLELPYTALKAWMLEEIYHISVLWNLIPVIAHLDRYLDWYGQEEIQKVLEIPGAVIQINCSAIRSRKTRRFSLSLIQAGRPVVFGTDAHNMGSRGPDADLLFSSLKNKLSAKDWERLMAFNSSML